ncbi:MAG: hypothetical protein ACLFVU_11915 [Phycisphaerae bacterium]
MKLTNLIVLTLAALTVPAGSAFAAENEAKPGYRKGPIHMASEPLHDIFALTMEDGKLVLDREHWEKAAAPEKTKKRLEKLREQYRKRGLPEKMIELQLRRYQGLTGGISGLIANFGQKVGFTSRGQGNVNGQRSYTFGKMGFHASFVPAEDSFQALLVEDADDGKLLRFREHDNGLQITLVNGTGPLTLIVRQNLRGFSVFHLAGDKTVRKDAKDFSEFYTENRDYAENTLFPLLRFNGIRPPVTAYSQQVKSTVLNMLRKPLRKEERAKFRGMVADLQSDQFRTRQEASKKIGQTVLRGYPVYEKALAEEELSPEAQQRITDALAKHEKELKLPRLVLRLGLLTDTEYLVDLLGKTEGDNAKLIAARLEKLTGKEHGTEVDAWRKELSKQEKPADR